MISIWQGEQSHWSPSINGCWKGIISHWRQTARTTQRLLKCCREQNSSMRLLHSGQGLINSGEHVNNVRIINKHNKQTYFFSRQQINIYTRLNDSRVTLPKVLLSLLKGLGVLEYIVAAELHEHIRNFPIFVHNCMFWPSFLNPSSSNRDCFPLQFN